MKRMLWAVPVILAAAAVLGGEAQAQSSTTPQELDVSITITNSCTVSIASPISFGSQGSLATAVTATGTIDVNCTTDHPYDIALDAGEGTGATVEARLMTGPDDATITYSLYKDDQHAEVWGDDTVGETTKAGTGIGEAESHTVYGRIDAQVTPAAGAYSDSVAVVVHY